MKLKTILLLICFCSLNSYSIHKDKIYQKTYGNVTTLVKTGFENYGSTIRTEIIGELALKLSQKLFYTDTIILEFRHDYTNSYPKFHTVSKNLYLTPYVINGGLEGIIKKQRNGSKEHLGISIRQVNTDFNVKETLKLLEYCILNEFKNKRQKIKHKYDYENPNEKVTKIKYLGLSQKLINHINSLSDSIIIKELMSSNVEILNFNKVSGHFTNQTYYFNTGELNFETNDLKSLIQLEKGIGLLTSTNHFIYLNPNLKKIEEHKIDICGNRNTLYFQKYNFFEREKLTNSILIYKPYSKCGAIFSESENIIVRKTKK